MCPVDSDQSVTEGLRTLQTPERLPERSQDRRSLLTMFVQVLLAIGVTVVCVDGHESGSGVERVQCISENRELSICLRQFRFWHKNTFQSFQM